MNAAWYVQDGDRWIMALPEAQQKLDYMIMRHYDRSDHIRSNVKRIDEMNFQSCFEFESAVTGAKCVCLGDGLNYNEVEVETGIKRKLWKKIHL